MHQQWPGEKNTWNYYTRHCITIIIIIITYSKFFLVSNILFLSAVGTILAYADAPTSKDGQSRPCLVKYAQKSRKMKRNQTRKR